MNQNTKMQKSLIWAVIVSETSHIFCCVLPTVFSVLSLLAGAGMIAVMPPFMVHFHDIMHHWELPLILISGVILALGWAAMLYHDRVQCGHDDGHVHEHGEGCAHHHHHKEMVGMKSGTAHLVLKIATVLFVFNLVIYLGLHRSHWFMDQVLHVEHSHEDGHDAH